MEVSWPIAGSWALAVCSAVALLGFWWTKREKRRDALREQQLRKLDDLACANEEWRMAERNGTAFDVIRAKKNVMKIQGELLAIEKAIASLCVAVFFVGCATTTKPNERIVVVGEHAQIVAPGFVVPPYPDGESRWWLCTPTGLELMVPAFKREEW